VQAKALGRSFTGRTDADGRFTLAGLDGGASVVLTFRPADSGKIYLLGVDPAPGQPLHDLGDVEIGLANGSLLHLAASRAR
jgi:hypothetical protein